MRVGIILVVSLCLLVGGVLLTAYRETSSWPSLAGTFGGICILLGLILLDIYRLQPSPYHTVWTLLQEYVFIKMLVVLGEIFLRKLLRSCQDCQKEQAVLLSKILKQNKDTLFAKDNGLADIQAVDDFRSRMPLTRYIHYERYVDMITQKGDTNVLFPYDVDFVALTSGTTKGKSKGYPKSSKTRNYYAMPWVLLVLYRVKCMPGCYYLKRLFNVNMAVKTKMLRDRYVGDIPIATTMHGGTESLYGLNLDLLAEDVRYTLLVGCSFFEFIPEADMNNEHPATLLAHQLEVGQCYEIVVTTWDGLYRYRTEDIIQITGYMETVPVYKFIRRSGDILSTNMEKVPEVLLYESVMAAAMGWSNTTVVDFTSVENALVEQITGHVTGTSFYIVFLEMGVGDMVASAEKDQVDSELHTRHEVYAAMRRNGKMRPVKIVQVQPGTFDKVKTFMLQFNKEAYFMQYKLPRITRRIDILKMLLEQAYSTEFN